MGVIERENIAYIIWEKSLFSIGGKIEKKWELFVCLDKILIIKLNSWIAQIQLTNCFLKAINMYIPIHVFKERSKL